MASGGLLVSDMTEKTRSVKSGKKDELLEETGGSVRLGGAAVFIR